MKKGLVYIWILYFFSCSHDIEKNPIHEKLKGKYFCSVKNYSKSLSNNTVFLINETIDSNEVYFRSDNKILINKLGNGQIANFINNDSFYFKESNTSFTNYMYGRFYDKKLEYRFGTEFSSESNWKECSCTKAN